MDKSELKRAPRSRSFISRYLPYIIAYEFFMILLLLTILQLSPPGKSPPHDHDVQNATHQVGHTTITKRWGTVPTTEHYNRQEQIATLLAFLLPPLAVDQWYPHHWILAVFKMLTFGGFGTWWIADIIMWSEFLSGVWFMSPTHADS
jgi:hypothetical protein